MPIHPLIVHIPLAFGLTAPILGIAALLLVRGGHADKRIWILVVLWQVLLAASAYAAMATGELDRDRVEKLAGKENLDRHENAATLVILMSLGSVALGALAARKGGVYRQALIVAQIGILAAAVVTGKRGGEIVYVHGGIEIPTSSDHQNPRGIRQDGDRGQRP